MYFYFFIWFFTFWSSNDLESDMMEVNGPRIRNQRPQKPIYVFFWIFFIGFFSQTHCIEAGKFSFFKGCLGWIGGMRVVRLGWNWILIVSRYCRNFFEFFGSNLNWAKNRPRDLPPPLSIYVGSFFRIWYFLSWTNILPRGDIYSLYSSSPFVNLCRRYDPFRSC